MPNPSNPFAAIAAGHKDGGASGRGRSINGRSALYQNRNVNANRESRARGRGRGGGIGTGDRPGQERPSGTPLSNSPFAQLKSNAPSGNAGFENNTTNNTANQFGKPSPLGGSTKGSQAGPAFRAPSLPQTSFGNSVDRSRDPRPRPAPQKPARINAGMSSVPVDDNDYHDRYEKVCRLQDDPSHCLY
jgi:hypothetical protein